MKRLLFILAALLLLASCSGKKGGPTPQVCPEGAVDLGIVMTRENGTTYKLFWAKSNLSADGLCENPWDYGDYFAWGETEPKDSYTKYSYQYCSLSYIMLKYNEEDHLSQLQTGRGRDETRDDAAWAILDGNWRMPTGDEWDALFDNCDWRWTKRNDINGYLVTSRINGECIFLPAGGGKSQSSLDYLGGYGYYWSSSLDLDHQFPYKGRIVAFHSERAFWDAQDRYRGFSIRPVSE